MMRSLSTGEIALIRPLFKSSLAYHRVRCDINTANVGGAGNSITPAGVAHFSSYIYNNDFSGEGPDYKWVFVHEMTHVWQWQNCIQPVWGAVAAFIETLGNYPKAYAYTLNVSKSFRDYNIEQQGAIVADYWAVSSALLKAQCNSNSKTSVADYTQLMAEIQAARPPKSLLDCAPPF